MSTGDPFARLLQDAAAMQERGQSTLRALREIGDVQVGLSEKICVYSEHKVQLHRYAPLSRSARSARSARLPPLLVCYAMVNRHYMLDLRPDRSLIRELSSAGIDVYLLDWGYPDRSARTEVRQLSAINASRIFIV